MSAMRLSCLEWRDLHAGAGSHDSRPPGGVVAPREWLVGRPDFVGEKCRSSRSIGIGRFELRLTTSSRESLQRFEEGPAGPVRSVTSAS